MGIKGRFAFIKFPLAELYSEYLLCQTDLLCQGKLYKCKAPLDAHQLLIYLFLLQYLTLIVLNRTWGQGKRKSKEEETEQK